LGIGCWVLVGRYKVPMDVRKVEVWRAKCVKFEVCSVQCAVSRLKVVRRFWGGKIFWFVVGRKADREVGM
jgi:hypothetical protein